RLAHLTGGLRRVLVVLEVDVDGAAADLVRLPVDGGAGLERRRQRRPGAGLRRVDADRDRVVGDAGGVATLRHAARTALDAAGRAGRPDTRRPGASRAAGAGSAAAARGDR